MLIVERLQEKAAARQHLMKLLKRSGAPVGHDVTVGEIASGGRMPSLRCDTSRVDPKKGLIFWDTFYVGDIVDWSYEKTLLMILLGEEPSKADVNRFRGELRDKGLIPDELWRELDQLSSSLAPLDALAIGLQLMSPWSDADRHKGSTPEHELWRHTATDYMRLIAWLPELLGAIARRLEGKARIRGSEEALGLPWAERFLHFAGIDHSEGPLADAVTLYSVLHSDHGIGNASAHAGTLIATTMSNIFRSAVGASNALAGERHGFANRDVLVFINGIINKFGSDVTKSQVEQFMREHLAAGNKVPGIGHGVLRDVDPRFLELLSFCKRRGLDNPRLRVAAWIDELAPTVMSEKVQNRRANVDLGSGSAMTHGDHLPIEMMTPIFVGARLGGIVAQILRQQMENTPIERVRSKSTAQLVSAALAALDTGSDDYNALRQAAEDAGVPLELAA